MKLESRQDYRQRRHMRLRQRVQGTAEKPRMSVCISNRHIYVQFIDDQKSVTVAAVSTVGEATAGKINLAAAKRVGAQAAEAAKAKGIAAVVFDRGGFRYHGRIKALADAAREAGLKF